MAAGGNVSGTHIDLFVDYEKIPKNIQAILDKYSEGFEDGDYKALGEALKLVEAEGYTFEYGLDGSAYALRPKDVPLSQIEGYEDADEEFAEGGNVSSGKVSDYFKSLNLAALPEKAANYIKTEILPDADIDLLEPTEEDFVAVKDLVSSDYPAALSSEPAPAPAETGSGGEQSEWKDAIETLQMLLTKTKTQ